MPLQHATLMPMPEGVPEELHVACAGRLAVLSVRSQTVTFGGQTMSASRFEAVCGKGDAKKWKSSLWAASPEGIPLQVLERLPSAPASLSNVAGHVNSGLSLTQMLPSWDLGHVSFTRHRSWQIQHARAEGC